MDLCLRRVDEGGRCLDGDGMQDIPLISLQEKTEGTIEKYIIKQNSDYLAGLPLDIEDYRHGTTVNENLSSKIKSSFIVFSRLFRMQTNIISRRILKRDIFKIPYFTNYAHWLRTYHKDFILKILNYENMITKKIFRFMGGP